VADRVERRRILVRSYAIAAAVSLAYVALAGLDVRQVWPVFPLAAVVGSAGAFTNPARQSLLPQLLTRDQLQNGVIFGTMGFMATLQFLGPTVGGLVTDASGLAAAFTVEVLLLVAAAALFGRIRTEQPPPTGRTVFGDLADGVRYVMRTPALLGLLLLATVPGVLFVGPFAVSLPILVPDVFHASDKWVGLLWGCFGIGIFTGSLILTWRPLPRRGLAVCLSNLFGAGILMIYSRSESLPVSAAVLVAWGLGASVFMNYVVALLQHHAEPRMIGRVMSMYTLVFFVSMPIGYGQAGLFTRLLGPQPMLLASGIAAAAVALIFLVLFEGVRSLE
jgi:predicted MFS family arabinose efflux permease